MKITVSKFILILLFIFLTCQSHGSNSNNCERCADNSCTTCAQCDDDYFLYSGTCIDCENCNNYSQTNYCDVCPSSIHPLVWGLVAAGIVIIILIIIIICCCCCAGGAGGTKQTEGKQISSQTEIRLTPESEIQAVWNLDLERFSSKQKCVICIGSQVYLRTNCGHLFHPLCLFQWNFRQNGCPACQSPEISPLKIYCNTCYWQHIEIDASMLGSYLNNDRWKQCKGCASGEKISL